jgi:hypothetical protein
MIPQIPFVTLWHTSLLVALESRNSGTPAGRFVFFNSLLHHPAVKVSTNLDYDTLLIESHAPGVRVIELQA